MLGIGGGVVGGDETVGNFHHKGLGGLVDWLTDWACARFVVAVLGTALI